MTDDPKSIDQGPGSESNDGARRQALWLSWFTVLYNMAEGVIAPTLFREGWENLSGGNERA